MSQDGDQLGQHYHVLMRLAKSKSWGQADHESALREVTEAAAHTMGIERVNIWLFDEQRTKMVCVESYERSTRKHTKGVELTAADYPIYFRALDEERTIVANDAHSDPRTSEFSEGYLDVHGISSLLDAPLHSGGEVIGIVCHEHVGPPRIWTAEEQQFAGSLADLASQALAATARQQAQDALAESEKRLRKIITHALDAIVIVDSDSVITDWNPRAEVVFGWTRAEALGMTLYDTVIPVRHHDNHRQGMKRFLETGKGAIIDQRIEIVACNRDGHEFPVELAISPVRMGGTWMFSAFVRDITDRVRAEQEIRKLNAELEERVLERTSQLREAVEDKERLLEELQASSVELLDRLRELERKSEIIRGDLERAQVIQRSLLPASPPPLDGVHVDALYRPGMNVGGDLYDVVGLKDGRVALYVADAAGHGVAAAMLSVLFKQRLQLSDGNGGVLDPPEVLRRVNARLFEDDLLAQGLFLTAGYVLLDTKSGELRAASAGHTPLVLHRANGENILLERTGPALGLTEEAEFTEHRLEFQPGDRLMLFTDGLIEGLDPCNPDGILELLGPALTGASKLGPDRLRELYADAANRDGGGGDDVTLLMLQAEGGSSHFDNEPTGAAATVGVSAESEPTDGVLWIAEGDEETHLAVRGRGTWTDCPAFRRLAQATLEGGRHLTIDLSECVFLDSAFLGTLHEVVTRADAGQVTVHRPCQAVHSFFVELGLEHVLAAVRDQSASPPCEPGSVAQDPPARECQMRLLRAHEILSELSEENRERFSGVVAGLRAELGQQDPN